MQEVSRIGQFVSNNSKSARFHENGILRYAQTVTELDVSFLEHIRDEAGQGMDAFDMIASMDEPSASKQVKLASYLLTVLERIAARLEAYYASLSQESIYRPEIENNPARTRWNNVRRKVMDGSFFVLAKPPSMSASDGLSPGLRARPGQNGVDVDFAQIFASAQQTLHHSPHSMISPNPEVQQTRRLADMHTDRAAKNTQAPSTFDVQQQGNALRRMSTFINDNMSTIRRLSRLPAEYDFANLMATYGKHPQQSHETAIPNNHAKPPSSVNSMPGLRTRGNTGNGATSPLPAPAPLRLNIRTPSLEKNFQLNHRQSPAQFQPGPPPKNSLPPLPQHSPAPSSGSSQMSPNAAIGAAMMHLNRRQPPRSSTPLPASPRASLALSSSSSRRKLSSDTPTVPTIPVGLRAFKLAASVNGDEMKFQQLQARV